MKSLIAFVVAASLAGASGEPLRSAPTTAPSFRAGVETHLAALSARDMDALLPTLTSGKDLTMIAPNGFKFDTRQQFVDFHRQWFATKDDGKLAIEIVRLVESPALGHALIKYHYRFKDRSGAQQVSDSWLALTFALEQGTWRLVFDQNTLIIAPTAR